jgi:hypothetical protein
MLCLTDRRPGGRAPVVPRRPPALLGGTRIEAALQLPFNPGSLKRVYLVVARLPVALKEVAS